MFKKSFHHMTIMIVFTLMGSSLSEYASPVRAQTPVSPSQSSLHRDDPISDGLTASDWSQIQSLIARRGNRTTFSPLAVDSTIQQAYFKASNTDVDDEFGYSVAVSGDIVVVGARNEDSSAKGVNGDQDDNFAPESGAAYVFDRSGMGWSQKAYLKGSNTDQFDYFGRSVALSDDTVVVGAIGENSNAGAVYVFVRSGTSWSQQAYLKASNANAYDNFGLSVSISGDTVVIGAATESSNATGVNGNQSDNSAPEAGAAYVFVRSGTSWSQQAYLKASNTSAQDYFGNSVAVSDDTVVIGAYGEDSSDADSGAAYVFIRNGTTWSQQAFLKASNPDWCDWFGYSVAVSGDMVVGGARNEDSSATGVNGDQDDNSTEHAGAAYVFVRSETSWSQQAYLKASTTGASDEFGFSVAASGDTVVVGSIGDDSSATGVNGDPFDNSAPSAGAAHVFIRSGISWSPKAYLKASNTEMCDDFGWSVSMSGVTVVIGAKLEDSNATGVNGNQTNNWTSDSGAVYLFLTGKFTFLPITSKYVSQ